MSISDAYEIREFVVLTENTHKYSSTKVESGGGIAGQQNVSSTVTHHVSQDIWLRDPETQKETKFTCDNYTLDVRPGHSLVFFINRNTNNIERIVNINTGDISEGNGEYNNTGINNTIRENFNGGCSSSFLSMLPLFCPFILYVSLRSLIRGLLSKNRDEILEDVIGFISSAYMCNFWIQVYLYNSKCNDNIFDVLSGCRRIVFYGPYWWFFLPAFIGFLYYFRNTETSADDIKSHCYELDKLVRDYIHENY
ncbi:hypothetical protein [Aeromonas salmonicida]|uniref:hypothetical protein n=1 Tax=Aeromonas salmonicida TaxID=645 RepID=UPI003D259982